jgi:hypothetical protein
VDDGALADIWQMNQFQDRSREMEVGRGLAFVLGAFRSGTTLLRKMLDSHSRLYSPAETWFLLPLVNLWEGVGESSVYKPQQAAAAIKSHLSREQFVACCRAFAGRFYAANMPARASVFVDKTPPYLPMAGALPALFPEAKFVVLARDPRGILWSRYTWRHAQGASLESLVGGVAGDVRRLSSFVQANRCCVVNYESLCGEPMESLVRVCAWLDVAYEPGMVAYGGRGHHEGYGDENTRQYVQPHRESVQRWDLPKAVEAELMGLCGLESLASLGYGPAGSDRSAA